MKYYDSMQALIGNTPLVKLNHLELPEDARLFAKLELYNPAGSVKDRIGKYMLDDAESKGRLLPGGTIVEATAGNTGLGIAFAALNRGYRVIFVVPTKFSQEKQTLMHALGAEIINTPREKGMLGAEAKAIQLRDSIPGAISLEQFHNQSNPLAHYETTGPEIWRDLDGKIDYLVAGAGSGGTYTGVVRYLKEQNPNVRVVAVEPERSPVLRGGQAGSHAIQGIGANFVPANYDPAVVDEMIDVRDEDALSAARALVRSEGLLVGVSSGAAAWAALALSKRPENKGKTIVALLPDTGERYLSVFASEE